MTTDIWRRIDGSTTEPVAWADPDSDALSPSMRLGWIALCRCQEEDTWEQRKAEADAAGLFAERLEPVAQVHVDENGNRIEDPWTDFDIDDLLECLEREPGDEQWAADAITVIKQLRAGEPLPANVEKRAELTINELGPIVAYKEPGQHWVYSAWRGETVYALVRFDAEVRYPIVEMRKHVVEARPMKPDDPVPEGWMGVICFLRAAPKEVTTEPFGIAQPLQPAAWLAQFVIDRMGGTNDLPAWVKQSAEHWKTLEAENAELRDQIAQPLPADVEDAIEMCDAGWRIERSRHEQTDDPMHETRSKRFKNALDVLRRLSANLQSCNAAFARWKQETKLDVERIAELNAALAAPEEVTAEPPIAQDAAYWQEMFRLYKKWADAEIARLSPTPAPKDVQEAITNLELLDEALTHTDADPMDDEHKVLLDAIDVLRSMPVAQPPPADVEPKASDAVATCMQLADRMLCQLGPGSQQALKDTRKALLMQLLKMDAHPPVAEDWGDMLKRKGFPEHPETVDGFLGHKKDIYASDIEAFVQKLAETWDFLEYQGMKKSAAMVSKAIKLIRTLAAEPRELSSGEQDVMRAFVDSLEIPGQGILWYVDGQDRKAFTYAMRDFLQFVIEQWEANKK